MGTKQVAQIGFLAVALTVLLAFQNCLPSGVKSNNSSQPSQSVSGNGDGYGGKVTTYVNRSGTPCGDGSDVQAKIVVENDSGRAFLVRKDCSDVAPVPLPLPDVGLMPHNPANLIYGDRVFDQVTPTPVSSSLLCRGQGTELLSQPVLDQIPSQGPKRIHEVVDAVIRTETQDGGIRYAGRVILGIYDDKGNLQKIHDMGEVKVSLLHSQEGHLLYAGNTVHDHNSVFFLDVTEATWLADLSYHADIQPLEPNQPSGPLGPSDGLFKVPRLTCYRQ